MSLCIEKSLLARRFSNHNPTVFNSAFLRHAGVRAPNTVEFPPSDEVPPSSMTSMHSLGCWVVTSSWHVTSKVWEGIKASFPGIPRQRFTTFCILVPLIFAETVLTEWLPATFNVRSESAMIAALFISTLPMNLPLLVASGLLQWFCEQLGDSSFLTVVVVAPLWEETYYRVVVPWAINKVRRWINGASTKTDPAVPLESSPMTALEWYTSYCFGMAHILQYLGAINTQLAVDFVSDTEWLLDPELNHLLRKPVIEALSHSVVALVMHFWETPLYEKHGVFAAIGYHACWNFHVFVLRWLTPGRL